MRKEKIFNQFIISLFIIMSFFLIFNQIQISSLTNSNQGVKSTVSGSFSNSKYSSNLSSVDLSSIKSTAGSIAAVFPVDKIKNTNDAIKILLPHGTPFYGKAMGVSFDEPVKSLNLMAKSFMPLESQVKENNPKLFKRFVDFASMPIGISCEFCCGIGPSGISKNGNLKGGCQHNLAILYSALWLMKNTNLSNAQVLRESLRWKTLFFPKNMISLATQVANGKINTQNLPSEVGGC